MNSRNEAHDNCAGSKKSATLGVSETQHRSAERSHRISPVYRSFFKRYFDIFLTMMCLPIILPTFFVLYLFVRRDGGPFLFSHERIGLGGRRFGCLKIRTMAVDAEDKLAELLERDPAAREYWYTHFKLKDDPRVSLFGRVLRLTSIDELPQIFNVLAGDMSFVGPRPITPAELDLYGPLAAEYMKARPGLTGPWQVTDRRSNDYSNRAKMDAFYVNNISFLRDLYILVATVPEVIFGRGK